MKAPVLPALFWLWTSSCVGADPIRVLIVDGVSNHDWQRTTAATRAALERTGRFKIDVSTSPRKRAGKKAWASWQPDFSAYQVVISNFDDDCEKKGGCDPLWSTRTRADFERFVADGGGFVAIHAAGDAFPRWTAYNEMIGVGGRGGRPAGKSGHVLRQVQGKWVATSPDRGLSAEHGEMRDFLVVHDRPTHPILEGLPSEWMHATDELSGALRGPARNVEVLAHSYSRVTGANEPVLMLISHGKGKVLHVPMGHYNDEFTPLGESLHCVGFQTILARGTEYVATGKVTVGVPAAFPGKDEAVVIAPERLSWPGRPAPRARDDQGTVERLEIEPLDDDHDDVPRSLRQAFAKRVMVFGIPVFASRSTPDAKVLHAASVLAEYLDNDEDGRPDNRRVVQAMREHRAGIMMYATQREAERREIEDDDEDDRDSRDRHLQGLFGEETHPGGAARGRFDATLEEVLHSITQFGYAEAYPEVFGERPGSTIARAMDRARGGHFRRVPRQYPADAWYTYDDRTCDYGCQITEYIYWGLTSLLDGQDFPDRGEDIAHEWRLNTPAKLKKGDPDLYRLLTDPEYRFPTALPDGRYGRGTKASR